MKHLLKIHPHSFLPKLTILFILNSCVNSPVKVSESNPHYFSYKNKTVVLITSDHHYGAVIDKDFDYGKFLDYLAANGMNLTRIYPGGMFETPDKYITGNPLGPLPGRQLLPWAKSDQPGANPLLAESGKPSFKYDLEKWNPEYFDRLKAFVEYARKKDIIVEVPFFNGMYNVCWPLMAMYRDNNIQKVGNYDVAACGLFTTNDARNQDVIKYQAAYVKKITTELNGFDNVIFDICDEPSLQGLPDGSVLSLPDSAVSPWINLMKDAFLEAEKELSNKHLLGQTIKNLSPDFSGQSWNQWLPTEYVKPSVNALSENYGNNKPLVNVESNYFGCSLSKNPYTADAVRLEGWWYMLSGGAGCINLNGEYFRGQETGGEITQKQIAPQKKVLIKFMNSLDLNGLSRFTNFSGTPDSAFCNALAEPGKQYALYLFHGSFESGWGAHFMTSLGNYRDTLILNEIPAGMYVMEWIDPVSGKTISSETHNWKGGNMDLTTPPYSVDIAFRMKLSD
jgi:hypothetical protein